MANTGVDVSEIIGVIAPSEMSITLTVLTVIFLALMGTVYYCWKRGWIMTKHPIGVTIRELRGNDLAVKNRTKARLIEDGTHVFYRIRNGFLPWNNIDWVPPPDYKFIDARDHIDFYAPNRDEFHAIMPEVKKQMTARLAEDGLGDVEITMHIEPGGMNVLIPIEIIKPEVGWKQDMSTAAKAYYRMGTEDIARRAETLSWFKEYQGVVSMVIVGMFLLFLFYISWQPLVDNSISTATSLRTQKEIVESLERIQTKMGIQPEEEEEPKPPPGG